MNRNLYIIITIAAAIVLSFGQLLAETRERSDVALKDQWKLEDLYASDEAWNKAKEKLVAEFDKVLKYQGKLAESASSLLE